MDDNHNTVMKGLEFTAHETGHVSIVTVSRYGLRRAEPDIAPSMECTSGMCTEVQAWPTFYPALLDQFCSEFCNPVCKHTMNS